MGKVPAIEDGTIKLFESKAIQRYIISKTQCKEEFLPVKGKDKANLELMLAFNDSTVQPAFTQLWVTAFLRPKLFGKEPTADELK